MGPARLSTLTQIAIGGETFSALTATAQVIRGMEQTQAVLVRRARNEGATWTQIAESLGVSKQAVHKRYGGRGLFAAQR